MKKLVITALFFSLALALTACGEKELEDNESYKAGETKDVVIEDTDTGQSQGGPGEAVVD